MKKILFFITAFIFFALPALQGQTKVWENETIEQVKITQPGTYEINRTFNNEYGNKVNSDSCDKTPVADAGPSTRAVYDHSNDKRWKKNTGLVMLDLISTRVVYDHGNDGKEIVTLDGSGSYDPDGQIVDYIWKVGSDIIATGMTADVLLYAQIFYPITLEVTDNDNLTATDQITVLVSAGSNDNDDNNDDNNHPANAVRLWTDSDYKGTKALFTIGDYNQADLVAAGMKNNDAHSIKVLPGYEATVFTGGNFDGSSKVFTLDAPRLGGSFSNQVSSLRVRYIGN